jgi:hypothetical protein
MATAAVNSGIDNRRWPTRRWLLIASAVVFLFLFIQAATYTGIVEWLAEWQFARFGRYFPTLTLAVLLLAFIGLWIVIDRLRRRTRNQKQLVDPLVRDMRRLSSAASFLFITAGLSTLMGLGVLASYFQQPSMDGPPTIVDLSRGAATLEPGPARLTGVTAIGPVSRHSEDLLFWRSTQYFVPVGQTRLENGETVFNVFVEVDGPRARAMSRQMTGLFRFNALPAEVAQMYTNAQLPTARRSAVLFRSAGSADRSTLVLLVEFLVFALIATLFGLAMRRREQRLGKIQSAT